jgi:hypothetical protein
VLRRALVPAAAVAALALTPMTASAAPQSTPPTVPGHANLLADPAGHLPLTVTGPRGTVAHVPGGWVLATHGDGRAYAQSSAPAVNVRGAFTVSAWVWTGSARGAEYAVSQGAGANASFELGSAGAGGWNFTVLGAHGAQYTAFAPAKNRTVANGAWLTGVWNPATHRVYLYVNGVLAASHAAPGVTATTGGLELGRVRAGNRWTGAWNGVIGHVQLWNRALTPAQVAEIKKYGSPRGLRAAHEWLV